MKHSEGDYIGVVGSYAGIVFHNGKWMRFECGGCMRANGLLKNRLSNGDHLDVVTRMKSAPILYRHDAILHKSWIDRGKP